jgi:hypothetical protein
VPKHEWEKKEKEKLGLEITYHNFLQTKKIAYHKCENSVCISRPRNQIMSLLYKPGPPFNLKTLLTIQIVNYFQ